MSPAFPFFNLYEICDTFFHTRIFDFLLVFHAIWTFLGAVNVSVTAEAVASHALCGNEIVSVPERGRIDVVTRSLIVKVGT